MTLPTQVRHRFAEGETLVRRKKGMVIYMLDALKKPEFWYAVLLLLIFVSGTGAIKRYFKKLSKRCGKCKSVRKEEQKE